MKTSNVVDPVKLEVFKALYHSVAEEMGLVLRHTAFSPNIKERRDYSCAVFGSNGEIIAQGDHMPVHLGSMPMSVQAAINKHQMLEGDVVILNDPFAGGTHLPDLTMIAPVYVEEQKVAFYVANRAHHADIGGANPGSMGKATEIYQEGLRIPPVKLVSQGLVNQDIKDLFLSNVRLAEEREGDLTAQIGAIRTGIKRLKEVVDRYGEKECQKYAKYLVSYTGQMMKNLIKELPDGIYTAEDYLDDDGVNDTPIKIAVAITIKGQEAIIDFTGTDKQCNGPINAVLAITVSAVYYVFRCLLEESVPANAGILEPIKVIAPQNTIVNATLPAAVAAGNVETSQRIVDVLLKALYKILPNKIPAASQGTMNNLTLGGINPFTGKEFAYYETIAGGIGASSTSNGLSGAHSHMTNSLNTPIEALEYIYPLRVRHYSLRHNSGGNGRYCGGDGIIKEVEVLTSTQVNLLSDRRRFAPYGLDGGLDGKPGEAYIIRVNTKEPLTSKQSIELKAGERIVIETPGGGGYGKID